MGKGYIGNEPTALPVNGSDILDGTITWAKLAADARPVLMASVASTSGTSIDFTSIPTSVKRITYMLDGVTTNGTSGLRFQLGKAAGVETTGYVGNNAIALSGPSLTVASSTGGFDVLINTASYLVYGAITFTLLDAATFTWVATGSFSAQVSATTQYYVSGSKSLSAELDRVRLTTVGGTDAFDGGKVSVAYER